MCAYRPSAQFAALGCKAPSACRLEAHAVGGQLMPGQASRSQPQKRYMPFSRYLMNLFALLSWAKSSGALLAGQGGGANAWPSASLDRTKRPPIVPLFSSMSQSGTLIEK